MRTHTIILFSAVLFAAIYVTSANSADDEDNAAGEDMGKSMQDAFKKGKPKEMIGNFMKKMKGMMEKGKDGKPGGRGGKKYMEKMKGVFEKLKALKDSEGTDEEKMAKAKDIFKNMMPGKGGKNKEFQNGMNLFKKFGKKDKE